MFILPLSVLTNDEKNTENIFLLLLYDFTINHISSLFYCIVRQSVVIDTVAREISQKCCSFRDKNLICSHHFIKLFKISNEDYIYGGAVGLIRIFCATSAIYSTFSKKRSFNVGVVMFVCFF